MRGNEENRPFGLCWTMGVLCLLSSGCAGLPPTLTRVPAYEPKNVVTNEVAMDRVIQRVAVLPMVFQGEFSDRHMTVAKLDDIFRGELRKRGAFDSVFVDEAAMTNLTGRARWRVGEELPEDFFESLETTYHSQAVLFAMIDHYHPYPPQTIAWRMKLIDTRSQETIWEIDELFDMGNVTVAQAAQEHFVVHQVGGTRHRDERAVFNSPRRFGQYTAAAALGTLPY